MAKRGANGAGGLRQRADGTWEGRYTVGRDPATGKLIRHSVYARTQADARRKLAEAVRDVDMGTYTAPNTMTVGEWLDYWLDNCTLDVKDSTRRLYRQRINSRVKPYLGAIRLQSLKATQVQALYVGLLQGDYGEPLAAKTIRDIHGILHRAFADAVSMGTLKTNPAAACKPPRAEKPPIVPLEPEHIKAFLAAIQGDSYEDIIKLALYTGMRLGEVTGITWDEVNLDNGTITLRHQLSYDRKGQYSLQPLKTDTPRTITLAPSALAIVRAQKAKQAQQQLLAGSAWSGNPWGMVFTTPLGDHINKALPSKHAHAALVSINAPATRFHDLRHTYAIMLLAAGENVKNVQNNLGHYSAAFTLDTYGGVTDAMRQDNAARTEEMIKAFVK